jgi:hypothetical protein
MLPVLVVALGATALVGSIAACCMGRIVSAKHEGMVRNTLTQQTRKLATGMNLVLPWETTIELRLPFGGGNMRFSEFPTNTNMYYRYDPAPYAVLTADQVEASIDLWINYSLTDLAYAADYQANFLMLLDDAVRAEAQELVSNMARTKLNAVELAKRFAQVKWEPLNGLTIRRVGVQSIHFDPQMQEMLRGQSAGLSATEAAEHVERMALGQNHNASVIVDGSGMGLGRRAARQTAVVAAMDRRQPTSFIDDTIVTRGRRGNVAKEEDDAEDDQ